MPKIAYTAKGKGPVVVFLHGFCESRLVWDPISDVVPDGFHYLFPDIPGFGESPLSSSSVTLPQVADSLIGWLNSLQVNDFILIGHSMGGYIALEMAHQAGIRCRGLGLFHSTAAADSEAKKENRTKSAGFIRKNGTEVFFRTFIPGLYHRRGPWESDVRRMIRSTSEKSVVAYTLAMRDRPDYRSFISSFPGKTLFIAGEYDSFIPAESIREQAGQARDALFVLLSDTGHLGMQENPEEAARAVRDYLRR